MKSRTFKDRQMQGMYDKCRALNAEGKFQNEGPTCGTSHEAYWNGRRGVKANRYSRNSLAYAAWAAGVDDAKVQCRCHHKQAFHGPQGCCAIVGLGGNGRCDCKKFTPRAIAAQK